MKTSNLARFAIRSVCGFLVLVLPLPGQAQIRTDGSLGMPGQTLNGANVQIPETLGKRAGSNLFHSFQTFNINPGESATFTTATTGLLNVISRVTGGSPSQINGPLTLTASHGAPAFYFINPAGVFFGPGASLNVPGAFYVSTANYLKFPDGNFYADTSSSSTFSSAEPAAFGFLGTSRATVIVKDAVLSNNSGPLALLGGDVTIDHAGVWTEHGDIRLVAQGSAAGEIASSGPLPIAEGRLEVSNGSGVFSVAGTQNRGGNIDIAAGETHLRSAAAISTSTSTAMAAGAINASFGSLEIDGLGVSGSTGITSFGSINDVGQGGNVSISARDGIRILGGGLITSDTYGLGPSGNLTLVAGSLSLDGAGHRNGARLTNRAAAGNAGMLSVSAAESIELVNASQISSDSFGPGQAGTISLRAGGDIRVLADSVIASNAYDKGNAGSIDVSARNLTIDGSGGQFLTQISSQAFYVSQGNAGTISINVPGLVSMLNGGKVITDTSNTGRAGDIQLNAGSLLLDSRNYSGLTGIYSSTNFDSTGRGGSIKVKVTDDAQIVQTAQVSTSTWGLGNAGDIQFGANNLAIDGRGEGAAGIRSEVAQSGSGQGGSVAVDVPGRLKILDRGLISAATYSNGNAGTLDIYAGQLMADGMTSGKAGIQNSNLGNGQGNAGAVRLTVRDDTLLTGGGHIRSDAGASGQAGKLALAFGGALRVEDGGLITSVTSGSGRGGDIGIQVNGNLTIGRKNGLLGGLITNFSTSSGQAGNISLAIAGKLDLGIGGAINSQALGSGKAGDIEISAAQISLRGGDIENLAWISNDSRGSGAAGSISIKATQSISLGEAGFISSDSYSSGDAGKVTVEAPEIRIGGGDLQIGAAISSDAYAEGNAGRVVVSTKALSIEGGDSLFPTGINTRSKPFSSGNAGSILVDSRGPLQLLKGGEIASSTAGSGAGGEVLVKAATLDIVGNGSQIAAMATPSSAGQPGSVAVFADSTLSLSDGGRLSIENDGVSIHPELLLPATLKASAAHLLLRDASIKANASGNVAAGALDISFGERLSLTRSSITTSANAGNGGPIKISGQQAIDLNKSEITTSVLGASGNGGNINIKARALSMNSGFIQANTAAPEASGGNVTIDVKALLSSGNTLFVGGQQPYRFTPDIFGFNVIQAAAPTGLSGTVNITSPSLDISGTLSGFAVKLLDTGGLGRNPCQIVAGNSFVQSGRGGFAPSARELLAPPPEPRKPSGSDPISSFTKGLYAEPAMKKCRPE